MIKAPHSITRRSGSFARTGARVSKTGRPMAMET